MKLSKKQEEVYAKLTSKPQSAHAMGCPISTLNALVARGLANKITKIGSIFSPRTNIYFTKKI
jgi:hypothetical protein